MVVNIIVKFLFDICVLFNVVDEELQFILNDVCVVICKVVELLGMLFVEQLSVVVVGNVVVVMVFGGVLEMFVKLNVVDCIW